jgi:hypothetical protein
VLFLLVLLLMLMLALLILVLVLVLVRLLVLVLETVRPSWPTQGPGTPAGPWCPSPCYLLACPLNSSSQG